MLIKKIRFTALALAAGGLTFAMPAAAVPAMHTQTWSPATAYNDDTARYDNDDDDRRWGRRDRSERPEARRYQRDQRRSYRDHRGYEQVSHNTRTWRGNDGRYYCRKSDGTTGLLIGGAAGALLGREAAGNGDRTLGAILGAAGGALLGKSIDSKATCR